MLVLPKGVRHMPAYLSRSVQEALVEEVRSIVQQAPLFVPAMPRTGKQMSVRMTNCGSLGWVSSVTGYRYDAVDPDNGNRWPRLPRAFLRLAKDAAARAGFAGFVPDACLVNRYEPGARLTLHRDRNERDFEAPIVSVSLGLPATFLFGGLARSDRPLRVQLHHGDTVVWGGPARLRYHGVAALKAGEHDRMGAQRINLTLRKAG